MPVDQSLTSRRRRCRSRLPSPIALLLLLTAAAFTTAPSPTSAAATTMASAAARTNQPKHHLRHQRAVAEEESNLFNEPLVATVPEGTEEDATSAVYDAIDQFIDAESSKEGDNIADEQAMTQAVFTAIDELITAQIGAQEEDVAAVYNAIEEYIDAESKDATALYNAIDELVTNNNSEVGVNDPNSPSGTRPGLPVPDGNVVVEGTDNPSTPAATVESPIVGNAQDASSNQPNDNSDGNGGNNNNNTNMQTIILSTVFATLAVFCIIGLLYAHKRRKRANSANSSNNDKDGLLNIATAKTEDSAPELMPTQQQQPAAAAESSSSNWAANAYNSLIASGNKNDTNSSSSFSPKSYNSDLLSPKSFNGTHDATASLTSTAAPTAMAQAAGAPNNSSTRGQEQNWGEGDVSDKATVASTAVPTAAAQAAGAPNSSSSSRGIQKHQHWVSPSTTDVSDKATVASGISTVVPTPMAKAAGITTSASSSSAEATGAAVRVSTSKAAKEIDTILEDFSDGDSSFISDSSAATSGIDGEGSCISGLSGILGESLPGGTPLDDRMLSKYSTDSATNGGNNNSSGGGGYLPKNLVPPSRTPSGSSLRKQESFKGTYRTRSAMAKLNLKKDILHVAEDTNKEGGMSSRTVSAENSVRLMEKQRLSEKKFHGVKNNKQGSRKNGKGNNKQGNDEVDDLNSSRSLILPADFERSDSVVGGVSSVEEENDSS